MAPTSHPRSAGKPQRGIQSIDVGGRLLLAVLRGQGPMMLKDLADAAQMPPAKAHAYLVSFCRLGLMEQDPITGRYELGPLALELGLASLSRLDAIKVATPELVALSQRTGHSTSMAVWGNYGPTIVRFEQAVRPVHVNMRTGTVMALGQTATAQIFAAFLDPAAQEAALRAAHPEPKQRAAVARELADRADLFADVRRRGLARAQGQPVPGVNAFSAPVFDHTGQLVLSLTVLGAAAELDAAWSNPIAHDLQATAARISQRLGYSAERVGRDAGRDADD